MSKVDKELDKILEDNLGEGWPKDSSLKTAISNLLSQAFRNGQLDCQKAGDPTNHKYYKEAVSLELEKQDIKSRIDELESFVANGWNSANSLHYVQERLASLSQSPIKKEDKA
jgi:hypothetical protein